MPRRSRPTSKRPSPTGALAPGAELPPIRELAGQLGVNPNTVGRRVSPAARTRCRRDRGPARHPGAGPSGDHAPARCAASPSHRVRATCPPATRTRPCCPSPLSEQAQRAAPVLYGEPAVSADLADYARSSLTADGVPAEHIAGDRGALDGIERVLAAHLRPGDRVAVEDPGWANLLDLLAALGFSAEPVGVDDDGPRDRRRRPRAAARCARAGRDHPRAEPDRCGCVRRARQGAARVARRASTTCCSSKTTTAPVSPAHRCITLAGIDPALGVRAVGGQGLRPDLRLALLAGDQRTVERVHGRLRLGPGWISHLLQDLAVGLWRDDAATQLSARRPKPPTPATVNCSVPALADRGVASTAGPGSTSGFRCPTRRSRSPGYSAQVGPRHREPGSGSAAGRESGSPSRGSTAEEIEPLGRRDRRGAACRGTRKHVAASY